MATRILIVDDEPMVRQSIALMLSEIGCVAESACHATEALAKLKAQPFDLVVTDFIMRGLNGRQLAWIIKSLYPRLPIILLTGSFPSGPIEEIDYVLPKPCSMQQLWTAIGEVFVRAVSRSDTSLPEPALGPQVV